MRDEPSDYALVIRWRNEPHVAEWWTTDDDPTPTTPERVAEQYGPRTEDAAWVTSCIISLGDRPVVCIGKPGGGYSRGYYTADIRAAIAAAHDTDHGDDEVTGEDY